MTDWPTLLRKPTRLEAPGVAETWFDAIAEKLLNGATLRAGGKAHRLVEVEFYLHGAEHPDPFAHRDPLQLQCGRWYFHRTAGAYRSGSFKGLDLTFGDGTMHGGVLLRGLETEDGTLIDGPSLLVDHLLKLTKAASVRVLDSMIANRAAWDASSPVRLEDTDSARTQPLFRCGRVGLTLKNARNKPAATRFILKPYRYLSEPRRISKGKLHVVIAMHARGILPSEIRDRTGCPTGAIERWVTDYQEGITESDFTPYFGIELGPRELARLHGSWYAKYGR